MRCHNDGKVIRLYFAAEAESGLERISTGLPVRRTDQIAMLAPNCAALSLGSSFGGTTDAVVVDLNRLQHALWIDDEAAAP